LRLSDCLFFVEIRHESATLEEYKNSGFDSLWKDFSRIDSPHIRSYSMAETSGNNQMLSGNSDERVASSSSQHTSYHTADPGEVKETVSMLVLIPQESAASDESTALAGGRLLRPAPGYQRHLAVEKASSRFSRWLGKRNRVASQKEAEQGGKTAAMFVIIGMFDGRDRVPKQRLVRIGRPSMLFWTIWWNIIWIRSTTIF
jgi:hypothetical protein